MTLAVTILGCGSSGGVPRPALGWGACNPDNPKNRRRRCSILVEYYNPDTLRAHAAGSAFPLRDSRTGVLFCARWPDPVDDTAHVRWARRWAAELGEGAGAYSNYAQDTGRVGPGFTPDTLAAFHALEAAYDPDRLFAVGHRAALVAVSRTRRNE